MDIGIVREFEAKFYAIIVPELDGFSNVQFCNVLLKTLSEPRRNSSKSVTFKQIAVFQGLAFRFDIDLSRIVAWEFELLTGKEISKIEGGR